MSTTPSELLRAALQLPVESRAALVERLLESISDEHDRVDDELFVDELDARFEEFQRDPLSAISWEELRKR